jgi:hypothetical protein
MPIETQHMTSEPFSREEGQESVKIIEGVETKLTIRNILSTGSLGLAPTPSQYFVLLWSRWMSLYNFGFCGRPVTGSMACGASVARGTRGVGSYVPRTSIGFESRAVLGNSQLVKHDKKRGGQRRLPSLGDDDVEKRLALLAEARETDHDNHC